jgi:magnesium-transporting ATPase (P-type)
VYREALTMTQAGIVLCQFFNGFAVRSDRLSIFRIGFRSNPQYLVAQGVALAIMCAISYAPPLQDLFHTAPLSVTDWGLLIVLGSLVLVADEVRKAVLRRKEART